MNKEKSKKKKNGKTSGKARNSSIASTQMFRVRKGLSTVMPPMYRAELSYSTDFTLQSASNPFVITHRLLNGLYDPDDGQSLNNRNYTGFNDLMKVYNRCLCEKIFFKIKLTNNESFPVTVTSMARSFSLAGLTITAPIIQNFREQPYGQKNTVSGNSAKGEAVIAGVFDMAVLNGSRSLYFNEFVNWTYFDSNPIDPKYHYIGAYGPNNLDQGVQVSLEYTAQVVFAELFIPIDEETIPPALFRQSTRDKYLAVHQKLGARIQALQDSKT